VTWLAHLRRITQEATPGPWKWVDLPESKRPHYLQATGRDYRKVLHLVASWSKAYVPKDEDARFIATFNPAFVNTLLNAVEAAEAYRTAEYDLPEAWQATVAALAAVRDASPEAGVARETVPPPAPRFSALDQKDAT
jgi:hypothetical protein